MMKGLLRRKTSLWFLCVVWGGTSHAQEVAPQENLRSLRAEASAQLQVLSSLRAQTPRGLYAAFDHDRAHPYVLPACDDDGDPVVVISDAALSLLEIASYGLARDQQYGTKTLADYGRVLRRSQQADAPLLPPGERFFTDVSALEAVATEHFRHGLRFWLGLATAAHDAQELRCDHPDTLRERGDAVWTDQERSLALLRVRALTDARAPLRVSWALAGSLALAPTQRPEDIAVTLTTLTHQHPWASPFPLPTAALVRDTAVALRALAAAAAESAAPEPRPEAPPPKPKRRAPRFSRALP